MIDRFGISIPASQMMLFVFFVASAAGALIGGIIGDRIGRYRISWISVLGPLPFTLLLPYADLFWMGVLTITINLTMSSAFASILIYAMELVPTVWADRWVILWPQFRARGHRRGHSRRTRTQYRHRAGLPHLLFPAARRVVGMAAAQNRGWP